MTVLFNQKNRLIKELEYHFEIIRTPSLAQDIEKNESNEEIQLQALMMSFVIAKEIDSVNYLLMRVFLLTVLSETSKLFFCCTLLAAARPLFYDPASPSYTWFYNASMEMNHIFLTAAILVSMLQIYIASNKAINFGLFHYNRATVVNIFKNNYTLQKSINCHFIALLNPAIAAVFERNKQIAMGYLINAGQEKRRIQYQLFCAKFNPLCDWVHLQEVYRLLTAFENFHSGKKVAALNNLSDAFSIPHFQSIADGIVSQIFLMLSPVLTQCTHDQKKRFLQLMQQGSKQQPDSAEFYYASFLLQHPNEEDIPLDFTPDNQSENKNLNVLTERDRQAIIKNVIKICSPVTSCSKNLVMRKNNYFPNRLFIWTEASFWKTSSKKLNVDDNNRIETNHFHMA